MMRMSKEVSAMTVPGAAPVPDKWNRTSGRSAPVSTFMRPPKPRPRRPAPRNQKPVPGRNPGRVDHARKFARRRCYLVATPIALLPLIASGFCTFFGTSRFAATVNGLLPGTGFIGSTFATAAGFAFLGLVVFAEAADAHSPHASALAAITTMVFLIIIAPWVSSSLALSQHHLALRQ